MIDCCDFWPVCGCFNNPLNICTRGRTPASSTLVAMETHASIYAQHALLVLVHGGPVQQIGTRETASDHWLHLNSVLLKDFLLAKDSVRFRAKHCKPLCGGRYKGCVDVDSCSQVLTGSESLISIVKSARDSLIWAKVGIIYPHRVHPCFYQIFRFKSDTIAKG